jgi:hypothetical protein
MVDGVETPQPRKRVLKPVDPVNAEVSDDESDDALRQ